jgi:hypothetical protein
LSDDDRISKIFWQLQRILVLKEPKRVLWRPKLLRERKKIQRRSFAVVLPHHNLSPKQTAAGRVGGGLAAAGGQGEIAHDYLQMIIAVFS